MLLLRISLRGLQLIYLPLLLRGNPVGKSSYWGHIRGRIRLELVFKRDIAISLGHLLRFDMLHHRPTDLASRRPVLTLAHAVMIQDTPATQAMRSFAILISAFLHVLPQRNHLAAKFSLARCTFLAFTGVAKKHQTLLLLLYNLSFLS